MSAKTSSDSDTNRVEERREKDRPAILAPPPILLVVVVLAAVVADRFVPLPLVQNNLRFLLGAAALAVGLAIGFSAVREFRSHREHPSPYKPTNAIVDSGIYGVSRNPIYLSFFVIVLAVAFFVNSWWVVIAIVPLFLLLRFGVIAAEERYLSNKFGAPYDDYRRRVRRWI